MAFRPGQASIIAALTRSALVRMAAGRSRCISSIHALSPAPLATTTSSPASHSNFLPETSASRSKNTFSPIRPPCGACSIQNVLPALRLCAPNGREGPLACFQSHSFSKTSSNAKLLSPIAAKNTIEMWDFVQIRLPQSVHSAHAVRERAPTAAAFFAQRRRAGEKPLPRQTHRSAADEAPPAVLPRALHQGRGQKRSPRGNPP